MPMIEFENVAVGTELPGREFRPDAVQLFLFNAAIWNPHRVHYDADYATRVEGHAGVLVDGPLQAEWLAQMVLEWVDEAADLVSFAYTNRRAAVLGDVLRSEGRIVATDPATRQATVELCVRNGAGEVTTPATAVVRFRRAGGGPARTGEPRR